MEDSQSLFLQELYVHALTMVYISHGLHQPQFPGGLFSSDEETYNLSIISVKSGKSFLCVHVLSSLTNAQTNFLMAPMSMSLGH